MNNPKQQKLNIELTEEVADGIYANLAIINHSASEFIVDFIKIMPTGTAPKAKVKSRIILTPQHAKRLVRALNENVKRFESVHGTIKDYDKSATPPPINFGPGSEA